MLRSTFRDSVSRMRRTDIALAAVLTAWMLAEVWAEDLRPAAVVAPLMVLAGVSVAWRRVYPILVMLVLVVIAIAQALAGMTMHSAVSPVVALLVVSWSIGAYEDRRRAILALTVLVCGLWIGMAVSMMRGSDHYEGTDFPWIGALLVAP